MNIGKKDEHGNQVRIEHRGKNIRVSRTGGVAARAQEKLGPVNVTVNTSKGARFSTRVAKGARVAFQNSRFQLIGRWRSGPLGVNLSKTGMSASIKNEAGTFNFIKPQYSSFKFAGIQVRGRKAAEMQAIFIAISTAITGVVLAVKLAIYVTWLAYLVLSFLWDFFYGIMSQPRYEPPPTPRDPKHPEDADFDR